MRLDIIGVKSWKKGLFHFNFLWHLFCYSANMFRIVKLLLCISAVGLLVVLIHLEPWHIHAFATFCHFCVIPLFNKSRDLFLKLVVWLKSENIHCCYRPVTLLQMSKGSGGSTQKPWRVAVANWFFKYIAFSK